MKKALILGGGFSGCTMAHLLGREGWDCTILEKEGVLGGGCRTFFYGGHPYTKGPRPYYGYSEKIFRWVDSFVKMRRFPHYLLSYVEQDGQFYAYPIHEDDIPKMKRSDKIRKELAETDPGKKPEDFEEYWINKVGPTLYEMFVNRYSRKMWLIDSNKELDTFSWSAKDKVIESGSKECYKGSIIAYPVAKDGYNTYFEKTSAAATVLFNENVSGIDLKNRTVKISDGTTLKGDVLVSSIPLEELCGGSRGELLYAGRDFVVFVLPCRQVFPGDIRFCHYTQDEPYTRIVEYKKLTFHEAEDTLLVMEFPSKSNKLYPYMIKEQLERAREYLSDLSENVYSIGRLGTYRYSTIEQTISQCFATYRKITGKSADGMEKEFFNLGDLEIIKTRSGSGN
ncbi:MAG: NAD(P)-binding protein [Deltaproteobacteria bacterium]|nr:NAD(P)-binding protein [Deltaproteobacteria bacterium]